MKNTTQIASTHFTALVLLSAFLLFFLAGCAEPTYNKGQVEIDKFLQLHVEDAIDADDFIPDQNDDITELPVRFQKPTFLFSETVDLDDDEFAIPVGADITSSTGPVPLKSILKKLVALKEMNVSWASDVDQDALVDVDIRVDDDFFDAIDNLLRQLDYSYEIERNSLVVKYKTTKRFYVAMPFMKPSFETKVGLKSDSESGGQGSFSLENVGHSADSFDIWTNIEENLMKILGKEQALSLRDKTQKAKKALRGEMLLAQQTNSDNFSKETTTFVMEGDEKNDFYFTIDKPVGMLTVTAPRSVMGKVSAYFDNLQKHIYRQVTIEAKFVEVSLNSDNRTGIDWNDLLGGTKPFGFNLDFQRFSREHVPDGDPFSDFLTIDNKSFTLLLDLIEDQGHTEILASPKISVLNGQPAMINVGVKTEYLKKITTTVSDSGVPSYSTETDEVMSGIGLAVVATILNEDQVILNLTPITSDVIAWDEPTVGGDKLRLPNTSVREMNTLVNVKSGSILVIGGLTSSKADYESTGVAGLKNVPGTVGKAFRADGSIVNKKELIILLRPVIHGFR